MCRNARRDTLCPVDPPPPNPADPRAAPTDAEERAVSEFLEILAIDRLEGRSLPLEHYISRFASFEERIRNEYTNSETPAPQAGGERMIFGPYRLLRELGRGGQGVVYLAEDARVKRTVALKVLNEVWWSREGEARLRLEREAATLARLNHPGICTLFDTGTIRESLGRDVSFLAMRYIEGETLAKKISDRRQSDSSQSERIDFMHWVQFIEKLARAVHAAHVQGILHRDLKPANVMTTPQNDPVILDFGLARDDDSNLPTLTRAEDRLGTPAYMAPEQLDERFGSVDVRTDVWALGVILWECLTSRHPFEGPTKEAVVRKILEEDPPNINQLNRSIPKDLFIISATALDKNPARRYRSALDFAEDLRRFRGHEPILARAATPWTRLARWAQRQPALATSLAATFFILISGFTVSVILMQKSQAALEDVARLSDARTLRELLAKERKLFPTIPERVHGPDGMDAWLRHANELINRLPDHKLSLQRLRDRRKEEQSPALNSQIPASDETNTLGWWEEQLTQLVSDLEKLPTTISSVEKRRAFALDVDRLTISEHQEDWNRASAAIEREPKYHGLKLSPQRGLIPIGPDPASGLWEFSHLETGAVAARDASGKLMINGQCGIVFVLIPGGTFRVGADAPSASRPAGAPHVDPFIRDWEGPSHEVELDPYFLSKYEMTSGQWVRITGKIPSDRQAGRLGVDKNDPLRHPVEQVSWEDCNALLQQIGLELPTEVQWEHGARGDTSTIWWSGNDVLSLVGKENIADRFAKENGGADNWDYDLNFNDGWLSSAPVGSFAPNAFGLFDVAGNLSEWVRETWEDYSDHPARKGDGFRAGDFRYRVARGSNFSMNPMNGRSARRAGLPQQITMPSHGVRPSRAANR